MSESVLTSLTNLRNLRATGQTTAALAEINRLLKKYRNHADVLVEAIHIYLIAGFSEQAIRLSSVLAKHPAHSYKLPPECALRLKLLGSELNLSSLNDEQILQPGWVQHYLQTNEDTLFETHFISHTIRCFDGEVNYDFDCQCPACNGAYKFTVSTTFLLYREYYCPHCLARLLVEFEVIAVYLDKQNATLSREQIKTADHKLRELQFGLDMDATSGKVYPLSSRYLSQDYVFLINHFVLNRLGN